MRLSPQVETYYRRIGNTSKSQGRREIRGIKAAVLPERVSDRQQIQENETTEPQDRVKPEHMGLLPPESNGADVSG